MAEHRRVEPRSILGSGMATDPERVREIEEEAARKERSWRERGDASFGDVLRKAPARAALDDEAEAGRQDEAPSKDDDAAPGDTDDPKADDAKVDDENKRAAAAPKRPVGPRAPADPRAKLLHQLLDAKSGPKARPAPILTTTGETPPTGSVKNAADANKKKAPT